MQVAKGKVGQKYPIQIKHQGGSEGRNALYSCEGLTYFLKVKG